jgi:rhodanese-related sulfurtransferase
VPLTKIPRISPREAADKLAEGWVYVDVRPDEEFEEAHPAGALNVPYSLDEARFVAAVRAAAGDGARLVLGCKSGIVSIYAAEMLARAGFEVVEQRAGFDGARGTFGELEEEGWARAGLPVERTEE